MGPDESVEIIVRKLSNEDMLRMMAAENMEEWGTSAWVEMETVRATIAAYGKGLIELPKVSDQAPPKMISGAREALAYFNIPSPSPDSGMDVQDQ